MSIFGFLIVIFLLIFVLVPSLLLGFIGRLFGGRSRRDRYNTPSQGPFQGDGKGEGDVFVSDNTPDQKEKVIDDSVGTYVDYEEVEEK